MCINDTPLLPALHYGIHVLTLNMFGFSPLAKPSTVLPHSLQKHQRQANQSIREDSRGSEAYRCKLLLYDVLHFPKWTVVLDMKLDDTILDGRPVFVSCC